MRTFRKILRKFLIYLVITCLFFVVINIYVSPITNRIALSHAKLLAYNEINNSISETMSGIDVDYDDMVTIKYDDEMNVKSIETNSKSINMVKTYIIQSMTKKIAKYDMTTIYIPIGSFTGNDFLSGMGPDISITVQFGACATTDVMNEFNSAGINQTCHRLLIKVTVEILVISFGYNLTDSVDCECCIAETVIVGKLPETYININ